MQLRCLRSSILIDRVSLISESSATRTTRSIQEWDIARRRDLLPIEHGLSELIDNSRTDVEQTLPILRDHPHLGLLVAGLHFHENPIFSRWRFTLASSSATRLTICGSGVS